LFSDKRKKGNKRMKKKNKKNKNRHSQIKNTHLHIQTPDTPTLSVCMIVKNEEENLPRVLSSIQGLADEVIVVDTGSTDRTVEIAKSFGAKVYFFEWCDDFSAARNESLKYATCDYVLWLDGDDEVPESEHEIIKRDLLLKRGNAFYLHIKNNMNGVEDISLQLRVFPNKKRIRFSGRVHEQVIRAVTMAGIKISVSEATIIHHGYYSNEEVLKKLNRNIKILMEELKKDPDNNNTIFFIARTLRGLNKIDEANHYLDRLIEIGEKNEKIKFTDMFGMVALEKVSILCSKNEIKEAISFLEQMKMPQGDNVLIFTLGELYYKTGDYDNAYKYLKAIRDETFNNCLTPVNPQGCKKNLNTYLGISSLFAKDYSTARECFNYLINIEPDNMEYYQYLILCEEKAGNIDKALKLCSDALIRFEREPSFIKKRFLLLIEKGDLVSAIDELNLIEESLYDPEVIAGGFLINCMTLNLNGINHFYRLLFNNLFIPEKPFPEDYQKIMDMLKKLNENKALSLFEKGIKHLLGLDANKPKENPAINA